MHTNTYTDYIYLSCANKNATRNMFDMSKLREMGKIPRFVYYRVSQMLLLLLAIDAI